MKTSIYLRPGDAAKLAALGMSASEAVREFCAGRGEDGMPLTQPGPVRGIVLLTDPEACDPSDVLPDPEPAAPHGWRRQGLRWIARAGSLDDAARLASMAVGAKLAAPYVPLTAEEVNDA